MNSTVQRLNDSVRTARVAHFLALPPACARSLIGEFASNRFAGCDCALKAHVATRTRINAALEGAAPAPGPGQAGTA